MTSTIGTTIWGSSSLGVPILVGDEAIGVISLQSVEHEHMYTEAHVRLLTTVAATVGALWWAIARSNRREI